MKRIWRVVTVTILCCFLIVTSLSGGALKSVGLYSTNSASIAHLNSAREMAGTTAEVAPPTIYAAAIAAAELIAIAYAAGYVAGKLAHYAYDYYSGQHVASIASAGVSVAYNAYDFSQFDN